MSRHHHRLAVVLVVSVCGASLWPALPAAAHTGQSLHGLWAGLAHPLLGIDHVFAMVTVGILAMTHDRPWRVPGTFLAAMSLGGLIGIAGFALPGTELAIALSVVALGGALAAGQMVRPELALGLVALAGFVHGHAHGVEVPVAAHPLVYVLGFLVATATLHIVGVAIGLWARARASTRVTLGTAVFGAGLGLMTGVIH